MDSLQSYAQTAPAISPITRLRSSSTGKNPTLSPFVRPLLVALGWALLTMQHPPAKHIDKGLILTAFGDNTIA